MYYVEGNIFFRLKDTHSVFWWVSLNVNITFVCLQDNSTEHLWLEAPLITYEIRSKDSLT